MAAEELTVAGRRFRTRADYEAALRDQKKIDSIKAHTDMKSPKQLYELFAELQSGVYRFESVIGNDFDDEIYEKIEQLKAKGITAANADSYVSGGKTGGKQKSKEKHKEKKSTDKRDKLSGSEHTSAEKGSRHSKKVKLDDYDQEMREQIIAELKKQERHRKLIVVLASIVAIACFGYFGAYYFFSARTNMDYEALADLKGSEALVNTNRQIKGDGLFVHKTSIDMPDILDEYKTLYEKNKKLIGWLKIDDTIIDYPIMQTSDNEYYLEHNFNQEYDKNGSLFLDKDCVVYPQSTNLIIYGHHMKSGQMFGQLQKYAKESYGQKHALIHFDSIYEKGTYQVMYVFHSKVYNENDAVFKYYQFIEANSETEFNFYMDEMQKLSLYDTGVTASYGDCLLTLSTCDYSQTDGRFVVVAKRIK